MELKCGLKKRIEKTVEEKDTAKAVASGLAEVYATPSMITMMEHAAYSAVEDCLPEGCTTVGTAIDVKHLAATPVGLKVRAEAELTEIEGRKLKFSIEAYDEYEKIGEAVHYRYIVDKQRFLDKAYGKGKANER
jgi:fluoroacetyl-CoA thioesterase